ncbi:Dabb family protein [Streptomyces sp. BH055]|uniref:Dabb family protein n=1 Tax=Streptomyces sp. BH055 TaxID=3401173 RepID=UPI003BB5DCEC
MIRHVFMWQVADGNDPEEVVALLNKLKGLTSLRSWELGKHTGDPGDNGTPWDGVLINDFEDWQGLEDYSVDTLHTEVVAQLMPKLAARAVVDFEKEVTA